MVRMFVRHKVADYSTWKATYDGIESDQLGDGRNGARGLHLCRGSERRRRVARLREPAGGGGIRPFPELREAMQSAGVEGAPEIWFTTPVSATSSVPRVIGRRSRHRGT